MQNFSSIELDTANMTTEELKETKSKLHLLLSNIETQLTLRKIAERKYKSSVNSKPDIF